MLSEKEIYIEDINNNIDMFRKIKEKKAEFPHLKSEDTKILIDLTNPKEEEIKDKLNILIQENLEVGELSEFLI